MAATKIAAMPLGGGLGLTPDVGRGAVSANNLEGALPPCATETTLVWKHNLEEEIERMRDLAEDYQHVAMDAHGPGVVARPLGPFSDHGAYNYQTLKCNVELTKVIQIVMTFSDEKGNRPKEGSTWKFNFAFDARRDLCTQEDCIDSRSARGLDLGRHKTEGIEPQAFAELLMSSGLVLNEDIRWVTYRCTTSLLERPPEEGAPGRPREKPWVTYCGLYAFAHLLQMLMPEPLPGNARSFQDNLDLFFPSRCDVAMHLHRLGLAPVSSGGNGLETRSAPLARNPHNLLEAFFRLPDTIRRTAFDREEESLPAANEYLRKGKA